MPPRGAGLGVPRAEEPARHIAHAEAFRAAGEARYGPAGPRAFLDLGSGAGIPGLVLALRWPDAGVLLLDGSTRRTEFARACAERLGLADRVRVVCERAEVSGRQPELRGRYPLVVARSFGTPAVTAELASAFVEEGGWIIVSEPPDPAPDRWPSAGLAMLGCSAASFERHHGFGVVAIRRERPLNERYPRRVGVPSKRPLW